MKKLLLFVAGLFVFVGVNAQGFAVGAKGGLTLSTISTDMIGDFSYGQGLNASVFVQKRILPMFSLRPALGVYQKNYNAELVSLNYETKINYAQLDFNLRFKPPVIPVYFVAGPYFGYALSGQTKMGSVSYDLSFGKDESNAALDYGISGFIGYQQNLVLGKLFVEVGYLYGLKDVDNNSSQVFNRTFVANVGLAIGL